MTNDERSSLERAFGGLEGEVRSLTSQWRNQDQAATAARVALHDKVEQLRIDVTVLTGQVAEMNRDIVEIKPIVQESRDRHQQSVGVKWAVALVWSAIVTVIGGAAVVVFEAVKYFWPKP